MPDIHTLRHSNQPIAVRPRLAVGALALLLGLGAALRLKAATGDLWLDEVWSLAILGQLQAKAGPFGMLLAVFHDNTHPLNSLWLALVGSEAAPILQRLLSIAASIATLVVAAAIGWRRSPTEALILTFLLVLSYPLLAIGTEARGYGTLMLAALVAFGEHDRLPADADQPSRWGTVACILGLLSHYTFLLVLGGLVAWTAWRARTQGLSPAALTRRLWRFHRWPGLLLLLGLALLAPGLMVGGGEPASPTAQLALLARLGVGVDGFASTAASGAFLLPLLALAVLAIARLAMRQDDSAVFFAVVVVGAPLAVTLSGLVDHVQPRYFLCAVLFGLVLAARAMGDLHTRHRGLTIAAGLALMAYAIGQAELLSKFFGPMRGQYGLAIRSMQAQAPATVAAEGGFRPQFTLKLQLAHQLSDGTVPGKLDQVGTDGAPAAPPDWCVVEFSKTLEPMASIDSCASASAPYKLAGAYPAWGLSGTGWLLYRKQQGISGR